MVLWAAVGWLAGIDLFLKFMFFFVVIFVFGDDDAMLLNVENFDLLPHG